jgi:hypothetical protein
MMPRFRVPFCCVAVLFVSLSAFAQQEPAQPRPQTARQALIEIVTNGANTMPKHLTVEVQELLKTKKISSPGLYWPTGIVPQSGLQSFETGDILFVYNDSAQRTKYEVHVDSDDLAGDEDTFVLSLHASKNGREEESEWDYMASHSTVLLKMQQNSWRLSKISFGVEFPVGDPRFIEKTFLKGVANGLGATSTTHAASHAGSEPGEQARPPMPVDQILRTLALSQSMFAQMHPDIGFACTLSELGDVSQMMGVDQQIMTGSYNGYRFALAGCDRKPAGSFQITAEPIMARPGAKAFCTDATHNVRSSDDGRGATCLSSGKLYQHSEDAAVVGVHFEHDQESPPKQ